MLDRRDLITDRVGDFLHRVPAEVSDIINRLRARLLEHEFQLALLIGRVHGDENHSGEPAGELQQHPFRNIIGIDRDPRPFGMSAGQGSGEAFGVSEQFGIGPGASDIAFKREFLQRHPIRRRRR